MDSKINDTSDYVNKGKKLNIRKFRAYLIYENTFKKDLEKN